VNDDVRWMDDALRLGRRALGTTAENPPVGCVIVKEGRVLGVGCTASGGRPHAETQALAMAGGEARGSTAYVTLEPCAHHGRTPPCAAAFIAAGVVRVVTAIEDPDPRTAGAGHRMLRDAGIATETGLGAGEARRTLAGFLSRMMRKRPYVTLKLALSADGMIAERPGVRTPITGRQANARVHLWRSQSDAILVGRGTVEADDPDLTCRLPGLEARSPLRLVLSARGTLAATAKLAQSAAAYPVMVVSAVEATTASHVSLLLCRATPKGVDLGDVLSQLAERGINRLLVEGGARVAESFLADDLVDEMRIFRGPATLGPQGVSAPAAAGGRFNLLATETLGRDQLSVYERAH
jgi:diaminohydroxyphosphoribosylaminopyrimidine deaminase / 5-amino-6-(5-phosphoribosylamino)uracil reductase